jgi:hypothetical protein
MKITEHQLKEIYQKNANRQRSPGCPSADELYALLSDSLDSSERERMRSHLEDCRDCAEEFRSAHQLSAELVKTLPKRSRIWNKPALLAAAVVVLALSAGIIFYTRTSVISRDNIERGEQHFEFWTNPQDGAQLEEAPQVLEWSAIPGVRTYRIILLRYDFSVLFESSLLSSTSFRISNEVRHELKSGQPYYWRLQYEKDAEEKSKLFRFNIR